MAGRVLVDGYDLVLLDLDGVVYVGGHAVPYAADALQQVRAKGIAVGYVTNNAARTSQQIAAHLTDLSIPATAEEVVTSAQAAATMLAQQHPAGSRVAVLGTDGLIQALEERGLVPVGVDEDADAIVSGYAPDMPWRMIMRAATRIKDGLPWIAANTDGSLPTPFGEAPGHGAQVEMLSRFAGVIPAVAGKPATPLFNEAHRRLGGSRVLMVGDRLDTDIWGANNAGLDSLLVLTGVNTRAEAAAAAKEQRPTYIADDLRGLLQPASGLAAG